MTAAEWEPGDPLPGRHRMAQHQGFLYNFRELEYSEECRCADRASWPEPAFGSHALPEEDVFIRRFKKELGMTDG